MRKRIPYEAFIGAEAWAMGISVQCGDYLVHRLIDFSRGMAAYLVRV